MVGSRPLYFMFLCVGVTMIASTGDVQKAAVSQVPNSSRSSSEGGTCYRTDSTVIRHKHTKEYMRLFSKRRILNLLSLLLITDASHHWICPEFFFHSARGKNKNKMPDITKTIKVSPFLIASIEG